MALTEIPKTIKPITNLSVTPSLGAVVFGGHDALNPTALVGVKFSYDKIGSNIADTLGLEATVNYFTTSASSGAQRSADGYIFRGDLVYSATPRKKLVPFFVVGAGDILVNRGSTSQNSALVNYGFGIKYYLEEWLALRADLRQMFVYRNVSTSNIFEFSTGLTYIFGKEHKKKLPPPKTVTKPAQAVPTISETEEMQAQAPQAPALDLSVLDKLGVTSPAVIGISPTTPPFEPEAPPPRLGPLAPPEPGAAAPPAGGEAAPAPAGAGEEPPALAPEQPPAPPAEPQAAPEQAPAPAVQPEESQPAPQVQRREAKPQVATIYRMERLPDDQEGKAPQKGKKQGAKVVKRATVRFETGSAAIRPSYGGEMAELATALKATPGATIRIEAHGDGSTRDAAGRALAAKRGEKMRDYLVKFGIARSRISLISGKAGKNGAAVATVVAKEGQ